MDNKKWIFFEIGSTLIDESLCYEIRYKETTEGTNVSYQEFKDKVIEMAATSDNPYKEALHYFGLQNTKWYKELENLIRLPKASLNNSLKSISWALSQISP